MPHYLAFVHEAEGAFTAVIPDCPGCAAKGSNFEEAISNAVLALRDWMADRLGEGLSLPPPRPLGELRIDPGLAEDLATGPIVAGVPLLLDSGRPVRANISLDAGLLTAIDEAAKLRGLTRSAFLASAAREKIRSSR